MKAPDWRSLWLQAQIEWGRLGFGLVLALMLAALGTVAWLGLARDPEASVGELQQVLDKARARLRAGAVGVAPSAPQQQAMAAFYAVLGESSAIERHLGVLFEAAQRSGLGLGQAEYKWQIDLAGQTNRYQIRLPIKGEYGQVRAFCERVLSALPFASLDELNLKRDSIEDDTLAATVQFSLHLHSDVVQATGVRP